MAPALSGAVRRRLRDAMVPTAPTVINLAAMPDEEQVMFAQVAETVRQEERDLSHPTWVVEGRREGRRLAQVC